MTSYATHKLNKYKINISVFVHWREWEPVHPNLDYVSATVGNKQTLRTKSFGREGYENHASSSCNSQSSSFLEILHQVLYTGKILYFQP